MQLLNKQTLLYGSLALTLMATAWISTRQTESLEVIDPISAHTVSVATANSESDSSPAIQTAISFNPRTAGPVNSESHSSVDLFAVQEVVVNEPSPLEKAEVVKEIPTPPPVPALPFAYLGKFEDKTGIVVYLMESQVLFTVAQGEHIDENYQLVAISDQQLTFHYRPLNIQQTLYIK